VGIQSHTLSVMPQARTILRHNVDLRPGEKLAIIWDETVSTELAEATRIAAQEVGAEATLIVYEPLFYRPPEEFFWFAGRSLKEPFVIPSVVLASMEAADVILLLISDMEMQLSPSIRDLLGRGKRILIVPYLDTPKVRRLLFGEPGQVESVRREVEFYADILERGKTVHVTSKEGTDLEVSLGQYQVGRGTGVANRGQLQVVPAGQVLAVPDDGSAQGTLVIDRAIGGEQYKELHEPITLQVTHGDVNAIEGGMEARQLREFLASLDDARAYHLTELGIGVNPLCKFSGIGAPGEDTHKRGTVTFALGCDTHLGGSTPGPVHIDMAMRFPSLSVDGRDLVLDARLVKTAT
jgi:2,5-dihydroxypyridine 5,6-dioxygenase